MSMRDGMILESLRVRLDRWFDRFENGRFASKPIYSCLICMGLWWGLLFYAVLWGFEMTMIPTAFIVVGINTIFDKIIHFEL